MSNQTHYMSCSFKAKWEKSQAHWAVNGDGTLVVFVHGFGGSAAGTWAHFPSLLVGRDDCKGIDLVYFGYESKKGQAYTPSGALFDFLDELILNPAEIYNWSSPSNTPREETFKYRRVFPVAHSLGAIISEV